MGAVATLRLLLESGESPDVPDEGSLGVLVRTPLHVMCRNVGYATRHHAACFELLRDAGANLEAPDSVGYRPLHCAVCGGSVVLLSLLIQSGVEVDATCNSGATALHIATRRNAVDCVEVLLAAGAALDVRSDSGRTPFEHALHYSTWSHATPEQRARSRRTWPLFLRAGAQVPAIYTDNMGAEVPTDNMDPYLVRVRNAGGFQRYSQQHLARITSILETPLLPPELVRKVLEFWLHAGYYDFEPPPHSGGGSSDGDDDSEDDSDSDYYTD